MNWSDFLASLNPQQRAIADKIMGGGYDFTFGPNSPNPTREDLQTVMGGRYAPAGGFTVNGGYALAPQDYYLFTPEQRRALGIMDIGPASHRGLLERYFGPTSRGIRNLFQGGRNKVSNFFGGGQISSGPFQGWTREAMNQWHNAPGYNEITDPNTGNPYFGTNPGNTQGGPTMDNTNWVSTPWGNVPMALLANPQASNVISDYFNPPGQGPGTGGPTARVGGALAGTVSNLFLPGSGFITGPLVKMLIRAMQKGGGPRQTPMPRGSVPLAGGEQQPTETGGGADWGGFLNNMFSGLPPGFTENRPWEQSGGPMSAFGGAPTFTGPGQSGPMTGPGWHGGSIFGGRGSLTVPGGGNLGNLGGDAVVNGGALGSGALDRGIMARMAKGMPLGPWNPALTPDPGSVFSNWFLKQYPLSTRQGPFIIRNPAALQGQSSPMFARGMGQRQTF